MLVNGTKIVMTIKIAIVRLAAMATALYFILLVERRERRTIISL